MTQTSPSKKLCRGNTSAERPGLIFFRYKAGKEVWVSPEQFEHSRTLKKAVQAKHRTKPEYKEKMKIYFRAYNNLERSKKYRAEYHARPERHAQRREQWATDPEMRRKALEHSRTPEARALQKTTREKRKVAIREYMRTYLKEWYSLPQNRIAHNCRSRMRDAIKCAGVHKTSKSVQLLGCSMEFFRQHIENQFERGMSWQNYGYFWHVDHIHPIAAFDLTQPDQQKKAFHYTNCQPLWKDLNLSKGDKIPGQDELRGRHIRPTQN